ncbi:hypothetical protein SAMN06314019_10533 [Epsilonproteobacteria bacterium SCGC AD-311-C15]|jgi:hypothetical protein|nr:hypothetical protein SAMN06314019_10533 [Epsilonproteobacteria bacterium SCGC AD-311-C15]
MSVKKFIDSIAEYLQLDNFVISGKKKAIKDLLKKLKKRRLKIFESIRNAPYEDDTELQEELAIIALQIKKGEKILTRLNQKK